MDPRLRVVTQIPLTSLWDEQGELSFIRGARIGRDRIVELLRHGPLTIYVANVSKPLRRIPPDEVFRFWKSEVKPQLVEPDQLRAGVALEEFPNESFFAASEWRNEDGESVVLLESFH